MILFFSFSIILSILGILIISRNIFVHKKIPALFKVLSFTGMLILSGCRGLDIGNDTPMYIRYFNQLNGLEDLSSYSNRFEPCYRLFNCIIAQLNFDGHGLLFISALITLILMYKLFYKKSKYPWYSILMFMFLMFYYNSMCLMRQYIAVSITCIAIIYLSERKRILFILLVILAGLFHTSALVTLVLLPLMIIPFSSKKRVWYVLGATIVALGFGQLINIFIQIMPRYAGYLSGDYYLQNKLGTIIKILIWGLLFIFIDYMYIRNLKILEHSQKFEDIHNTDVLNNSEWNKIEYFSALIGFSICLASLQGAVLSRMATYFVIIFCVSVPNALSKMLNKKNKYYMALIIIVGCLAYNIVIFVFRPYWSGVLPYSFWN